MIFVKCPEQDCRMVNRIDRTALKNHIRNGGKPVFNCKGCKTRLEVMPVRAACSNSDCGKSYRYYDFMLNEAEPVVECPHCNALNRVLLKEVPGQFKKTANP